MRPGLVGTLEMSQEMPTSRRIDYSSRNGAPLVLVGACGGLIRDSRSKFSTLAERQTWSTISRVSTLMQLHPVRSASGYARATLVEDLSLYRDTLLLNLSSRTHDSNART
jgi:hypothetical protein